MPHINHRRQPRWDRFERANLLEQYRALRHQGLSERQAAKELEVPRTTLQAWRIWHDTLDIGPHVAAFFQSGPGLAFLHLWSAKTASRLWTPFFPPARIDRDAHLYG
jgi:hypothetical protein